MDNIAEHLEDYNELVDTSITDFRNLESTMKEKDEMIVKLTVF